MIPPMRTASPLRADQITAQAIQAASGVLVPEWCDHKGARLLFGFSRSHLYNLIAEGKIKSACIRRRGALRGRRVFSCESIRAFLNANVVEERQEEPAAPKVHPQRDPALAQLEAQNNALRRQLAKIGVVT